LPQSPPQVVSPQGSFRCQIPEVARSCQNTLSRSPTSVIRTTSLPATATGVFFFWPALPIFSFNGLVHCVCADRAPTYPAADRRKPKPSDRKAGVQLGDHDPPTPRDRAERSARV